MKRGRCSWKRKGRCGVWTADRPALQQDTQPLRQGALYTVLRGVCKAQAGAMLSCPNSVPNRKEARSGIFLSLVEEKPRLFSMGGSLSPAISSAFLTFCAFSEPRTARAQPSLPFSLLTFRGPRAAVPGRGRCSELRSHPFLLPLHKRPLLFGGLPVKGEH